MPALITALNAAGITVQNKHIDKQYETSALEIEQNIIKTFNTFTWEFKDIGDEIPNVSGKATIRYTLHEGDQTLVNHWLDNTDQWGSAIAIWGLNGPKFVNLTWFKINSTRYIAGKDGYVKY